MIQTHVWFDQSLYPSRPELVAACVPGEEGRRGRERAARARPSGGGVLRGPAREGRRGWRDGHGQVATSVDDDLAKRCVCA